jgi:multidrug efflux pump subunit AcrB
MNATDPDKRTGGPIAWMAGNPVAANLLMLVLLVGGFISLLRVKKEVFPDFELDIVNVSVSYPGASPEEVEQGIVLAIEEAVRGLDGVDQVTARAGEGFAQVSIEVLLGADAQKVYQDVQQEVDRIRTFPEDAERPAVTLAARKREVVQLALYGDQSETVLRNMADRIRDRLLQDENITQVELEGVRPHEVLVSISRENLRAYGITLSDIAARIRAAALELPGGGIKTTGGEILIRLNDRRDYAREFATLPVIRTADGSTVRLGDIAEVRDTFEDIDRFETYNGKPSVLIEVYRVGRQTPTQVADAVLRMVDELNAELPAGLKLALLRDLSDIYRQRAALLLKNGAIGLVLVMVLLGSFLEIRLAFWVMMGIPISFLGGLLLLTPFGLSINMISMFAFLIALGIVVDDAIVVGENVYEYHQRGVPFFQAAINGGREVAMPVTFSVLTNIVTFMPLYFVPGFIGKIWKVIPLVVITVFTISLGECLYILPAHLAHAERRRTRMGSWLHERQQRFSHAFSRWVRRRYLPFLEGVLHHRYLTVAVAVAILMVTIGYVRGKRIGMIPMPRTESDYAIVTAALPYGSPVAQTRTVRDRLEEAARAVAEENGGDNLVTGIYTLIGGSFRNVSGGHVVEVRAYLTDSDTRPIPTRRFTEYWRQRVGRIPGLEALIFESDRGGPGSGASINVELSHTDSGTLEKASGELADLLSDFPVVSDIDDGFSPGKPQFDFRMRPEGLALGLTASDVARQVRDAFYGAEALRQQRGRHEVKVKVQLPEAERVSEFDLEQLLVRTPAGVDVPLHEVAAAERGRAYTSIDRREGRRTVAVTGNAPASENQRILDTITESLLPQLREKYPNLGYSFEGRQADFIESMASLKVGFLMAIFAIYALLAVPFRSYTQPLIIMASIPFGIVGAVIGHVIMGYHLSIMSMMGVVALAGVVVNDSLVLIDFANRERRGGLSVHDAIVSAGTRRFRPILLTTLTTFGGLAPMIFETSRQARFMIPMALSLGYGIVFATLITLILVPSLYLIIEDIRLLTIRASRKATAQMS